MTEASTRNGARPVVLLTGFEPFAGEALNPSGEIVRVLDGEDVAGHRIVGAILPVSFSAAPSRMDALVAAHDPALVLALGQAGGRSGLSLERVAINLIDARIADNEGARPIDATVVTGGPGAYFTTLPVKAIEQRLRALGVPVAASLSAGSFVCNQVFYALAHRLAGSPVRGGFIHVPWLPEQAAVHAGEPCMSLEAMVAGVRAAIACALAVERDAAIPGGAIH